jgi:hypothetical protein
MAARDTVPHYFLVHDENMEEQDLTVVCCGNEKFRWGLFLGFKLSCGREGQDKTLFNCEYQFLQDFLFADRGM